MVRSGSCASRPVPHPRGVRPSTGRRPPAPVTASAGRGASTMHYGQTLQSHALHFFHLSFARSAVGLRLDDGAAQHRRRGAGAP